MEGALVPFNLLEEEVVEEVDREIQWDGFLLPLRHLSPPFH